MGPCQQMPEREYKKKFYREYNSLLEKGDASSGILSDIRKQFSVWDAHYGKYLPADKMSTILEVGCGGGGFLYYLRKAGYRRCRGIDISDEQVRLALDRGIDNIEKGDLRECLKAHPDSFNLIIARDVLEHFYKEETVEIAKLIYIALVPGGRCIIQTVNAESPFSMGYRYGDFSHEICFTRVSLGSILRMGGFSNPQFYPVRPVCRYSCLSALRCLIWQGIELLLRAYNLIETGSPAGIFTRNLIAIAKK